MREVVANSGFVDGYAISLAFVNIKLGIIELTIFFIPARFPACRGIVAANINILVDGMIVKFQGDV